MEENFHSVNQGLDPNEVPNMNVHPYNAIGRIETIFVVKDKDGNEKRIPSQGKSIGTGTLISPTLVITAAHNIYHRDS
jgi:V8-like Glu-specific endopeptidase